jgi:uncharacterized RDD family membrane protein YckC
VLNAERAESGGAGIEADSTVMKPSARFSRLTKPGRLGLAVAAILTVAAVIIAVVVTASTSVNPGRSNPGSGPRNAFMVYDEATNQLLFAGGASSGSSGSSPGMWRWSSGSWSKLSATIPPTQGFLVSVAYDGATHQVLLVVNGSTWAWNGDSWRDTHASTPGGFTPAAMAYDEETGQLVGVFSPASSMPPNGDTTWTWRSGRWTQLQATGSRLVPTLGSLVYDPSTSQLLYLGARPGPDNDFSGVDATWVWSSQGWRLLDVPIEPPWNYPRTLVYDQATRQVVLFESPVSPKSGDETWTWSGVKWTEQHPADSPPSRTGAALAYDASTSQLLLYGGMRFGKGNTSHTYQDTWDWTGTTWVKLSGS